MSGALTVRGLHAVRGAKPVLRGVDLDVAPGEIVALMGVSGAGKSTVLRTVAALEPFTEGTIDAGGFALRPGPVPRESRLRASWYVAHRIHETLASPRNTGVDQLSSVPMNLSVASAGGPGREDLPQFIVR